MGDENIDLSTEKNKVKAEQVKMINSVYEKLKYEIYEK